MHPLFEALFEDRARLHPAKARRIAANMAKLRELFGTMTPPAFFTRTFVLNGRLGQRVGHCIALS
jgi:hypothetical protein